MAGAQKIKGTFEALHMDAMKGSSQESHYEYYLNANGKRLAIQIGGSTTFRKPSKIFSKLFTGSQVELQGTVNGSILILGSSGSQLSSTAPSSAAPLPNTFGAQNILIILVNFQDDTSQPWTPSQVQNFFFASSGPNGFYQESSYGQTSFTGQVYGWFTLPMSAASCDLNQMATDADNDAAAAGVNLSSYPRRIYLYPYESLCGSGGNWGTIGGTPSRSWLNGGGSSLNNLNLGIFSHELGHNFGLYHSHGLQCQSLNGTPVEMSGDCTEHEYWDFYDTMGSGGGHFNAFQKERLGWINYGSSPPVTNVSSSGTYSIAPYETTGTGSKALKILKFTNPATGANTWYYVESRQGIGFDSGINGVFIHVTNDADSNSSNLLDMTPTTSGYSGGALAVGNSYSDPDVGLTISNLSSGPSGSTLQVNLSSPACVRAIPSVSVSPNTVYVATGGTTANYTFTVTNHDGSACSASTFQIMAGQGSQFYEMVPVGWTINIASPTMTLNPGATGSTNVSVTSPPNMTGNNPVNFYAQNTVDFVYFASTTGWYDVGSAPSPSPSPSPTPTPAPTKGHKK